MNDVARAMRNASSTAFVAAAMFLLVPVVVMIEAAAVPQDLLTLLQFTPHVLPAVLAVLVGITLRRGRLTTSLRALRVYVIAQLLFALLAVATFAAAVVTGAFTF